MIFRALIFSISFIILFSCKNSAGNQDESILQETMNSTTPEFVVDFPQKENTVEKTETKDRSLGGIIVTNYILKGQTNGNPYMYFVAHNHLPKKLQGLVATDPQLKIAFKAMLTGSAEKLGGFDFKFTDIDYEGQPGMESICKVFHGQGVIKSRVYRIDNNIFMISAGGKFIDIESVDSFLNSFRLKV